MRASELHELAAKVSAEARRLAVHEQSLAALRATAEKVLASADDSTDSACAQRELAAFELARDIIALLGPKEPKTFRVLRGSK
jgi:hypothetical protein